MVIPLGANDKHILEALELALTAERAGNLSQASEICSEILKFRPENFGALYLLGIMAAKVNEYQNAIDLLQRAIAAEPGGQNCAIVYNNIGVAYAGLKRWMDAIDCYKESLKLSQNHAIVFFNLGNAWRAAGNNELAIDNYNKAILLEPDSYEAYSNRGIAMRELKQYELAIDSFSKAIELNPDGTSLYGLALLTKMQICDWSELENKLAQLRTLIEARKKASPPFAVLSLLNSPVLHRAAAEVWAQGRIPPGNALGPFSARVKGGKVRVGYFSADFRDHPVSTLIAGVIESHNREKFEIYAISFGPDTQDASRKRLRGAFDKFIDVGTSSDREAVEMSRQIGLDIAVDLAGHTADSRPGIFAMRAAPLQINFLGYPGTLGLETMDYIVADRIVIPEECRSNYSEKIIYLPCFQPNDATRRIGDSTPNRRDLGLPERSVVFCCFNNAYKITPDIFSLWMRILNRVDSSVLWLSENNPSAKQNLRVEASRRGVDPNRLIFAGRVAKSDEHLARYRAADLFLDTCPYGAHATASDALWAGLPVLTSPSESFASRVAASLLVALDLPELIAPTSAIYESLAVGLALNHEKLSDIREKLSRNRLKSCLFDTKLFTQLIEKAYEKILERAHKSLPPDHILVEP